MNHTRPAGAQESNPTRLGSGPGVGRIRKETYAVSGTSSRAGSPAASRLRQVD